MSFKNMKVEDLLSVANDDFNLEVPEGTPKAVILAALTEAGITWEKAVEESLLAEDFDAALKEKEEEKRQQENTQNVITSTQFKEKPVTPAVTETEAKPTAETVTATVNRPAKTLIKMDRENPTFNIRGYKFTQQNPFALVTEADAEYLVELDEGFYYATPKEASEFYG